MDPIIITIDGKEVAVRASGATYIRYKNVFKRDLFKEFAAFEVAENGEVPEGALETLIRAGYIMAEQAEPSGLSFDEWCDQFSFIGLAKDIPQIAGILTNDKQTIDEAKKKSTQSAR